jgi:hypothetical protein
MYRTRLFSALEQTGFAIIVLSLFFNFVILLFIFFTSNYDFALDH